MPPVSRAKKVKKEIDINKLAKMAKLKFNEEEAVELTDDLEKLSSLIEALEELPEDDGIKNMDSPFRSDEVKNPKEREILIKNAPESTDGFFAVPEIGGCNE